MVDEILLTSVELAPKMGSRLGGFTGGRGRERSTRSLPYM
jgi:hypothetical protein